MAKPGNSFSSPSASPRSDPQKSSEKTAAKIACFDISGTLVHHQTERPMPLMPLLLDTLIHSGWRVYFVTRWDEPTARLLLEPFFHAAWHKPTWWKSPSPHSRKTDSNDWSKYTEKPNGGPFCWDERRGSAAEWRTLRMTYHPARTGRMVSLTPRGDSHA